MASFFEQFRDFLAPRFQLQQELGAGGQATVYLARDTELGRFVALKVLPPERASAAAAERFLREARILADLEHPNIVRIYDVGRETDPFIYYIMQYLPGESLAVRLTRTLLSPEEAVGLGRDLLEALAQAHARGVIHRDIKPNNIFWVDGRGILADFGIAKSSLDGKPPLTEPGQVPGTPGYIPPERQQRRDLPQGDLYSVGMVLYQSLTGRQWPADADPDGADWSDVPEEMRFALRRALARAPEERWPDAAAFRHALWRRTWLRPGLGLATVGAALVMGLWLGLLRPRVDLGIGRIEVTAEGTPPSLGDSLARRIAQRLSGYPDFTVGRPGQRWRARTTVNGTVTAPASGDGLVVLLWQAGQPPVALSLTPDSWRTTADIIADSLLLRLFGSSPLESELPVRVLPRDPEGLRLFLAAEKAFVRASVYEAYAGYRDAALVDRSCALCFWRHAEMARFLALPPATGDADEYRARVSEFPPNYQALIRAEIVPLDQRLDSLDALYRRAGNFLFAPFRWGDELQHRGPLVGQPRLGSAVGFTKATEIRRDFAPAWEHLAWLRIAEGDEHDAGAALETLQRLPPLAPAESPAPGTRDMLNVAYAWRFLPASQAGGLTERVLASAATHEGERLDAGARYLPHFGAPDGAVWLGEWLEARDYRPGSAMLAQALGHLGAGRPTRARQELARAVTRFGDQGLELLDLELEAARLMFDVDSVVAAAAWTDLDEHVSRLEQRLSGPLRPRAVWVRALLERRFRGATPAVPAGLPAPLAQLLRAYDVALHGSIPDALGSSRPLLMLRPESLGDPILRSVLHLLRAEWQAGAGRTQQADRELLWYENWDAIGLPVEEAQPMEVDWAFGPLARWRRLGLGAPEERRCTLARDVARLWGNGEAPYAARADSARAIAAASCKAAPS